MVYGTGSKGTEIGPTLALVPVYHAYSTAAPNCGPGSTGDVVKKELYFPLTNLSQVRLVPLRFNPRSEAGYMAYIVFDSLRSPRSF